MDVKKRNTGEIFFTKHGASINLSSSLRDAILPLKHFFFSVEGDFLVISRSEDETDYSLNLTKTNQAKATVYRLLNFIEIPEGKRCYLHHAEGNRFYFLLKKAR